MDDRRRFFRFESPVNVRYATKRGKGKERVLTKNISREGVAFSTDRRLIREEMLNMEFEIPGDNIPVFAEGIVAWVKQGRKKRKRIFDVGIKLTNMTGLDRGRILEYAYKQWLKLKNLKIKR